MFKIFRKESQVEKSVKPKVELSFTHLKDDFYRGQVCFGENTLVSVILQGEQELELFRLAYVNLITFDDSCAYMDLLMIEEV